MIWLVLFQYHIGRGHVGASMKAKLYHLLEHRAKEWYLFWSILIPWICVLLDFMFLPLFVLGSRYFAIPLWRGSGYTTMFVQGLIKITLSYHLFKRVSIIFVNQNGVIPDCWSVFVKEKPFFPFKYRYYYLFPGCGSSIWENLKVWSEWEKGKGKRSL